MQRPERAREKEPVAQRALIGLQKYHSFGFIFDDLNVVYV